MTLMHLATALVALHAASSPAKEPLFYDGLYYVYEEDNSCALYADYPNGDMLRLAYKGSAQTVYFTLFGDQFSRMEVGGKSFPIAIATEDDPERNIGAMAFIVENATRKGLNTSGGEEILDYLQGADRVTIYGPGSMRIVQFGTPDIDSALKRLKICGAEK